MDVKFPSRLSISIPVPSQISPQPVFPPRPGSLPASRIRLSAPSCTGQRDVQFVKDRRKDFADAPFVTPDAIERTLAISHEVDDLAVQARNIRLRAVEDFDTDNPCDSDTASPPIDFAETR